MAEKAAYSLKSNAARLGQRFVENISGKYHDASTASKVAGLCDKKGLQ